MNWKTPFDSMASVFARHLAQGRPLFAVGAVGVAVAGYQLLHPETVSARHVPITTKIVFNREIAQIFQRKCFQCHTENNVGFSLTTYKDARPWAVAIKEEILEKRMPPWSAAAGYGHFANDDSLTGREISLILSWADGGAPSGVLLADEDKPPVFLPPLDSWIQGAPDEVVKFAKDVKVAADSPYRVERFDVTTGFKEAKWLRAMQLNPDDRRVVHYAAFYDARDGRWLGTWTPSSQVSAMPAGSGVQLPAGAKINVEIGYRGNMEDGSGAMTLGFYFLDKPAAQTPALLDITTPAAAIPAGKTGERLRAETTLKSAMTITSMWPRLGDGAKSLELSAIRPDGSVDPMLWLNNYRAEWPAPYIVKEPASLPAGTRLVMTAYYDNATTASLSAKPSLTITALSSRPGGSLEK